MRSDFSTSVIKLIFCFWWLSSVCFAQTETRGIAADAAPQTAYRIHQGDKLSVKFFYQPELNEVSVIVRPDGFISLQMIDDLQVEGLTVTELKNRLEKEYAEILLKPIISVMILELVAPRVYIGGQINKPGRYDLRDGQTLVQMIFLAGGFTRDANQKLVVRARPDGKGGWQYQSANVSKMLNRKGTEPDLTLEDGDYIFVPESKISQITKAVEGFRGLLPRFF